TGFKCDWSSDVCSSDLEKVFAEAGDSFNRNVQVSADSENTSSSKIQYKLQIHNVAILAPRQMTTLAVEVRDVDRAVNDLQSTVRSEERRVGKDTRERCR